MLLIIRTIILVFYTSVATAHGVTVTTANIKVRVLQNNHFTLTLNYDPLIVHYNISKKEGKNIRLPKLANMREKDLSFEYEKIKDIIKNNIIISYNKRLLESKNIRFESLKIFRKKLLSRLQVELVKNKQHIDREFYQTVYIDGFFKTYKKNKELTILFPKSLKEVMVTYSEPKSKIILPDKDVSTYILNL